MSLIEPMYSQTNNRVFFSLNELLKDFKTIFDGNNSGIVKMVNSAENSEPFFF
jgi:hypothetical protein